ncbi:hypothetical protein CEY16_12385 [Halalkalibacillus sediminis]|uniref:VWFA domain-containing protein n=1 Tax=Halalkalibacillus sediminis TaxID=2018042 RepID=A0A2I0QT87_9BACI|nr:hypothetical protein CEY16_12385 [Halalkalibacillus sediminis]
MSKGTIQQLLLITDGCSNQGEDPVAVSSSIAQKGVSVNVIGVLDDDSTEQPMGLSEVNEIADAGNGVSRIVYADALSDTVQMVTKQAMTQTIQGFVSNEIKAIFGHEVKEDELTPETRGEIQEVVEELEETCNLNICILVDTSASMQHKMEAVKEAIDDLVISLHARTGNHLYTIYQYPAKKNVVKELMPWVNDQKSVAKVFPRLAAGGITPTGTAMMKVLQAFDHLPTEGSRGEDSNEIIDQSYGTSF